MSTLAYAALTARREEASPGTSTTSGAPGMRTFVDALAALVPAEVLSVHAAVLSFTTNTAPAQEGGGAVVTISDGCGSSAATQSVGNWIT